MEKNEKHLVLGILAHVDAGKTTLAERMLYLAGEIRKFGRVDKGNAFLDNFEMERERGITIFSKQASITWENVQITLLDTPGHVDFSAEMERTLQVLDYALLVISGPDGVRSHDRTLAKLLRQYRIPTFLFINKTDMNSFSEAEVMRQIQDTFDGQGILFDPKYLESEAFYDELAMCSETAMSQYLETGKVQRDQMKAMIRDREVFPCFLGSALKGDGVAEALDVITDFATQPSYPDSFRARVYKITRDNKGERLTHMKVTGGSLKTKQVLEQTEGKDEKADQIRIYAGGSYKTVDEVKAGEICAVTGLLHSFCGKGYGDASVADQPILEPVLSYGLILPEDVNIHDAILKMRQLEEEDPLLHIVWDEDSQQIQVRVMGEEQIKVLKELLLKRFGILAEFGSGSITYKETITDTVEGVGHFEPLRHYAEVHLLLESAERGSGLQFETDVSEDELDKNWQRLILTHLEEKSHRGVLMGREITDMKITLIAGRAHQKHTEGGDFRQATYRAIRQGLKKANSILLEPVYDFWMEVPSENVGRAMNDITRMYGEFAEPLFENDKAVLTGTAPVACMQNYQKELASYTHGLGSLICTLKGYEPCHNQNEVLEAAKYDSELDLENPTGSVFCAHGAGFVVPWDEVERYMHIQTKYSTKVREEEILPEKRTSAVYAFADGWGDEKELEEIFNRTYGSGKEPRNAWAKTKSADSYEMRRVHTEKPGKMKETQEEYLLVDGYNVIFGVPELKELSDINIDSARGKLLDMLCNYQGFKKCTLIAVFDAYKVEGGVGSVSRYHNIHVVFTKEAETADQYIEKTVHEIAKKYHVTVATSDALEQKIIFGAGADRMSAKGLWEEMERARLEIREQYLQENQRAGQSFFQSLSDETQSRLEEVRLGRIRIEDVEFKE